MSRQRHQPRRPRTQKGAPPTRSGAGLTQPMPREVSAFAERVRYLVDKHFDANVTAAARAIGVSQRGLAHVYHGERTEPRLSMVQALFRHFEGVDRDWLVLGKETSTGRQISAAAREQAKVLAKRAIDALNDEHVPTPPARRAANHR